MRPIQEYASAVSCCTEPVTEPFVICKTEFSYMVQTVRVTVPADMLQFMCKLLHEQQEEDSEHLFSGGRNGVMAFTANG